LLGYRRPTFIALNEMEANLHPDLLPALARGVARAAQRTRVWLVSHSEALAAALSTAGAVTPRVVEMRQCATWNDGLHAGGYFSEDDDDA
jgi:predicted ATPase